MSNGHPNDGSGHHGSGSPALTRILGESCRATAWDYAEVWLPDGQDGTLRLDAVWHQGTRDAAAFEAVSRAFKMRPMEGVIGRVFAFGRPECISDVQDLPETVFLRRDAAEGAGLRGCAAVPIGGAPRTQGVAAFFADATAHDNGELTAALTTVAERLRRHLDAGRAGAVAERGMPSTEAAGRAALAICETLLLTLVERRLLDREELHDWLHLAAESLRGQPDGNVNAATDPEAARLVDEIGGIANLFALGDGADAGSASNDGEPRGNGRT